MTLNSVLESRDDIYNLILQEISFAKNVRNSQQKEIIINWPGSSYNDLKKVNEEIEIYLIDPTTQTICKTSHEIQKDLEILAGF